MKVDYPIFGLKINRIVIYYSTVNYHALKDVACDYAKSRAAIGWLTQD